MSTSSKGSLESNKDDSFGWDDCKHQVMARIGRDVHIFEPLHFNLSRSDLDMELIDGDISSGTFFAKNDICLRFVSLSKDSADALTELTFLHNNRVFSKFIGSGIWAESPSEVKVRIGK